MPPSVEQKQYGEDDRRNRLLQILRPVGTAGDGVTVHQDVRMYVSRLESGNSVEHEFGDGRGGYFYVISGEAEVNDERLRTGDAAYVTGGGRLTVRAVGCQRADSRRYSAVAVAEEPVTCVCSA